MNLPKTATELGGDDTTSSFSTSAAIDQILRNGTNVRHGYRGIPEPEATIESLQETVSALKEIVEILIGQRGQRDLQMLKVKDVSVLGDDIVKYLINRLEP